MSRAKRTVTPDERPDSKFEPELGIATTQEAVSQTQNAALLIALPAEVKSEMEAKRLSRRPSLSTLPTTS
jgi:hypothetical protein